jgi:hypothetical protein
VRTKTALVELRKDSRDLRVFLKIVARRVLRGSESSPGSLGTSWRTGVT